MIRAPGSFDEPRIHMAVNCASIGCPALRNEAYVADKLDAQLENSVVRFLSDHSRNRFNPQIGKARSFEDFRLVRQGLRGARRVRRRPGWHSTPTSSPTIPNNSR